MSDDDEVQIVSVKTTPRGKWSVPNPLVRKGAKEDIFRNAREKLNMVNTVTVIKPRVEEPPASSKDISGTVSTSLTDSISQKPPASAVPVTPPRSEQPDLRPVSLTPDEILDLTDGCLDSDNEPSETSQDNHLDQENVSSTSFKRPNISSSPTTSKKLKLSPHVRNRASRFFGAGTSKENVEEKLSQVCQSASAKGKSPSPSSKKKRLPMNSPIRRLPSHQRVSGKNISPQKNKARRVLELGETHQKSTPQMQGEEKLPYYYDAFCFIVQKMRTNLNTQHLFTEKEQEGMKGFSENKPELQLYVRLINRKDKWLREEDIRYSDIAADLSSSFDLLENKNYVTFDLAQESLILLLSLLKVDELRVLCLKYKLKPGTKVSMMKDLLTIHRTQPALGTSNPMRNHVIAALGRCVRLTLEWRKVFRRCFLLFSMFHTIIDDIDGLSSAQALLLLQVKLENMEFPLEHKDIEPSTAVFEHRDQLIRYEEALELKHELRLAMDDKDWKSADILTRKLLDQFCSLLELEDEKLTMLSHPTCLRRFNAGSIYAYALTYGAEAMVKARNLVFAEEILRHLLKQQLYCTHYRGRWLLQLASMFHINAKNLVKAAQELYEGLSDRSLSSVDNMHLQERAEKVIKMKKNGLSPEWRDKLRDVMNTSLPVINHVEIPARAHPGSRPGLKKVYIRDLDDGSKEYLSVEELVIAHFRDSGFKGIHDEGRTVSALCLLAFWDIIYDTAVPCVFQSPYQEKPLDWGTSAFYEIRRKPIEKRLSEMIDKGAHAISEELTSSYEQHKGVICLIDWRRMENCNIKDLLCCITVPIFVAVCQRLLQNWKTHHCGFPDLLLWNSTKQKCMFIEVKSPNDTLSTIQCMWLHFLRTNGSDALVAQVRDCGSKSVKSCESLEK